MLSLLPFWLSLRLWHLPVSGEGRPPFDTSFLVHMTGMAQHLTPASVQGEFLKTLCLILTLRRCAVGSQSVQVRVDWVPIVGLLGIEALSWSSTHPDHAPDIEGASVAAPAAPRCLSNVALLLSRSSSAPCCSSICQPRHATRISIKEGSGWLLWLNARLPARHIVHVFAALLFLLLGSCFWGPLVEWLRRTGQPFRNPVLTAGTEAVGII